MSLIYHLALGTVISFVASIPLGPIALIVVQTAMSRGMQAARRIALGAVTMETIYCLIALMGVTIFLQVTGDFQEEVMWWLLLISVPVLSWLGVMNLRKPVRKDSPTLPPTSGGFLLGVSMNLLNPALFTYWVGINTVLKSRGWIHPNPADKVLYSIGVGLGAFLLLSLLSWWGSRSQQGLSYRTRWYLTRIMGLAYLFFALVSLHGVLFGLDINL